MDAESVGMVSIAIGLLLVIGVVRGTWKKLLSDVGLGTGGGSSKPAPMPDTPNPPGPQGGFITCTGPNGQTVLATPADCAAMGGTPSSQATTDVWGGQNTVTYQV